jgi:hypothetical protein
MRLMRGECRRRIVPVVLVVAAAVLAWFSFFRSRPTCPRAATEIFQGVVYGCARLPADAEARGALHWVRVDLAAPRIELYVTPLDPSAVSEGWQYRLRWISGVVDSERLSVAINGTLFGSNSVWPLRLPGDLARSVETVVADHIVSHVWEHTYLLRFDDQLRPNLSRTKPPTVAELHATKWGIGGQGVGLWDGQLRPGSDVKPDARTAIAIDRSRQLLFLAVGEFISPRRILLELAGLGAKDGMLLDGGSSTAMMIGADAHGMRPQILQGGWRPVATYFGVRARALRSGG